MAATTTIDPAVLGLIREGRNQEAADAAAIALQSNPRDAGYLALAALAYLGTGDDEYATSLANDAVRHDPTHGFPQAVRAQILLAQRDFTEAESAAKKAVAAAPNQPDTLLLLGRAQVATNNLEAAHGTLYQLAQIAPSMPGLAETWAQLQQAQASLELRRHQAQVAQAAAAAHVPAWQQVGSVSGQGITTGRGPKPPSYFWLSVPAMVMWCLVGVPALLYSIKVGSLWDSGDSAGAWAASRRARTLSIVAIVGSIALSTIFFKAGYYSTYRAR